MGNILTACTSKKHYVNMPDKLDEIVIKTPDDKLYNHNENAKNDHVNDPVNDPVKCSKK